MKRTIKASVLLLLTALLPACEREKRDFSPPPSASPASSQRAVELQPGAQVRNASVPTPSSRSGLYEENAYGVSQGKTLYNQFNCSGCHFQGGGGMGPPLMDDEWVYGSDPADIFNTIMQGRPNGMPSFGGKIVPDQAWQIVAYVRSMSGLLRKDVAPARSDDIQVRSQEQATEKAQPIKDTQP